jgi:hypothetical protein
VCEIHYKKQIIFFTSDNYEVSATPCTESGTAHALSSGVVETLLHETAVSESSYGDLVMIVAAQDRARFSRLAGGNAIRTIGRECTGGASHHVSPKYGIPS